MEIEWTTASIREVLQGLDNKTGLFAAQLPIALTWGKSRLGSFRCTRRGNRLEKMSFSFSLDYFSGQIPAAAAIHVIRHEYAHYLARIRSGTKAIESHGDEWKAACRSINTFPNEYYQRKHLYVISPDAVKRLYRAEDINNRIIVCTAAARPDSA